MVVEQNIHEDDCQKWLLLTGSGDLKTEPVTGLVGMPTHAMLAFLSTRHEGNVSILGVLGSQLGVETEQYWWSRCNHELYVTRRLVPILAFLS
jgi:hypothetical protein